MIITRGSDFWTYVADKCTSAVGLHVVTYSFRSGINNFKDKDGNHLGKPCVTINPTQRILDCIDRFCYQDKCSGSILLSNISQLSKEYHNIINIWPNIQWRHHRELHAKYVIIKLPRKYEIWVGSINLSDSGWKDLMLKVHSKKDKDLIIDGHNDLLCKSSKLTHKNIKYYTAV